MSENGENQFEMCHAFLRSKAFELGSIRTGAAAWRLDYSTQVEKGQSEFDEKLSDYFLSRQSSNGSRQRDDILFLPGGL